MNPLISVIVPVYNGQDYLEKCIQCIANQTYENLEIILVDDGSKDATPQICAKLEAQFKDPAYLEQFDKRRRILKLITLGDEGVSVARNRAMDEMTGDYFSFVDADDRILPNLLETLCGVLTETESDMCGCSFFSFGNEEEWTVSSQETQGTVIPEIMDGETFIRQQLLCGNTRCWSKLYKTAALGKLRFRRGLSIGEDMLFVLEAAKHAGKLAEISYKGYGYFLNAKGAMSRPFTINAMDQILCWEQAGELTGDSAQLRKILLVSILLVVGRIAVLPGGERQKYKAQLTYCHEKVKQYREKEACALLDGGYRVKVFLFRFVPHLYVALYHLMKK